MLLLLVFSLFIFSKAPYIEAEEISLETDDGSTIKELYNFGEVLNLSSSTLKYDGKEYKAVPILYLPNGQVISTNKVELTQSGLYTLKFSALLSSGREISKKFNFVVTEQLYSVGSEKSTLRYGNPEKYATDQQGILLSLANGDIFTYNKIIDLREKKASDSILKLFVIPHNIGISDALNIHVRFTDIYDPTNYVTVTAKDSGTLGSWGVGGIYMVANSRQQLPTGIEHSTGAIHINNLYGTGARFPMSGIPKDGGQIGEYYFEICWDYGERKVYGSSYYRLTGNNQLIADLDAPYMNVPWMGFTTGEVIMSIYASSYNMDTMNMVITNINGDNIEENSFKDNNAPDITIYTDAYGNGSGPFEAVVGKPFKIFEANALSKYDKDIVVGTSVYFNSDDGTKINCNIINGCFTPQLEGSYTIVYTAVDRFGNDTIEEIQVDAVNKTNQLFLFPIDEEKSAYAGQEIKLVSDLHILNNTGDTNVSITATLRSNPEIKYDINTIDYSFIPYYAGIYDIEYHYSDYIDKKVYESTLVVAFGDKPVFASKPVFPRYLIKDNKFVLPEIVAYDISEGSPLPIDYSISVLEDDSGDAKAVTGGVYTVQATQSVKFVYTASKGAQSETFTSETIPVIDVKQNNALDITKYFKVVNGSFEKTAHKDYISLSTTQNSSSLIFINSLQAFNFELQFNPDGLKNNFNAVNIYLTDSINPNICLKMTYSKKSTSASGFKLNDTGFAYEIKNNFYEADNSIFVFRYNNEDLQVYPSIGLSVDVEYDFNKNPFSGFPSNKVYLEIELSGLTGDSALKVYKLNNQPLCKIEEGEEKAPEIHVEHSSGDRIIGDVVTIAPVYAYDVLDSFVSLEVYVISPDGSYVIDNNGLALDGSINPSDYYTFTIDLPGQYVVEYLAIDGAGNYTDFSYYINVIDVQAPNITLNGIVETGKVNKSIKVAQATAVDNSDLNIIVYVFVECPDGSIIYLEGDAFTPETAGVYKVNYITGIVKKIGKDTVYIQGDEDGNIGFKQYVINVS